MSRSPSCGYSSAHASSMLMWKRKSEASLEGTVAAAAEVELSERL